MRRHNNLLCLAVLGAIASTTTAVAQDAPSIERTAALSEFGARLEALEQVVDDVSLSGALALLGQEYPDWTFERTSGFDGVATSISNDLGAVAGDHDYGLSKLRGAIFRNKSVSDDQRERALAIFTSVKEFVQLAYELERLVDAGSHEEAGEFYKSEVLELADEINRSIHRLSDDIDRTVKLSAL